MARETLKDMMQGVEFIGKPKLVARNTVKYTRPDNSEVIRFHHTDIVVIKGNTVTLDTGGWNTVTTRDRMTNFSPIRVSSKAGVLYANGYPVARTITFKNGEPVGIEKIQRQTAKQEKTREQIKEFCQRVTRDESIPMPNQGDCWGCAMRAEDGSHPMGETCLMEHVKQNYFHGSLIVRAMRAAGYKDVGIAMYLNNGNPDAWQRKVIKRALQKLLYQAAGI